jgi:uncharacterized protein
MSLAVSPRGPANEVRRTDRLSFASHRLLPLRDNDVAVLADESTGWCVLRRDEYEAIAAHLADDGQTLETTDDPAALLALWEAGLLLADGRPHPHTKQVRQPWPDALLLKLTGACNFDCTYCYDYEPKRFKARLSQERIEELVSFLLARQKGLALIFHGGEPLLRFEAIEKTVTFALREAGPDKRVSFSIQTNGSLLNDEIVDFLIRHEFSIGISLDGVSEAANTLRAVRRGRSALTVVHDLLERYPDLLRTRCGFLAVVSRTSAPGIPELALWLQSQGIQGLAISFLDLTGRGATLHDERLQPQEAVDVYRRMVALVREGSLTDLCFKSLTGRIQSMFTFQPRDLCHKGPCGAGSEFLVVDAFGQLRSCDCIYHSFFELKATEGNVVPHNHVEPARLAIIDRHASLRDGAGECGTCSLFGLCGGTCVAKAIAHHGTPQSVDPIECAVSKYLYPELLQEFATGGEMPLFAYYQRHRNAPRELAPELMTT